jgi:hypothetical protein
LPAVPAAVAEFDMEAAQLLDGELYVPTVTFVAKVKATAMELKEEPALVLNEICLAPELRSLRADPMLSFPTSFGKRLLHCVVEPLGAVASRILTCPDGRPTTAYVEMTRFIGEIGGGRSSEHSVVERAQALRTPVIILRAIPKPANSGKL